MAARREQQGVKLVSMKLVKFCKILKYLLEGYALKDVAVHYIMKTNPDVFARLGMT